MAREEETYIQNVKRANTIEDLQNWYDVSNPRQFKRQKGFQVTPRMKAAYDAQMKKLQKRVEERAQEQAEQMREIDDEFERTFTEPSQVTKDYVASEVERITKDEQVKAKLQALGYARSTDVDHVAVALVQEIMKDTEVDFEEAENYVADLSPKDVIDAFLNDGEIRRIALKLREKSVGLDDGMQDEAEQWEAREAPERLAQKALKAEWKETQERREQKRVLEAQELQERRKAQERLQAQEVEAFEAEQKDLEEKVERLMTETLESNPQKRDEYYDMLAQIPDHERSRRVEEILEDFRRREQAYMRRENSLRKERLMQSLMDDAGYTEADARERIFYDQDNDDSKASFVENAVHEHRLDQLATQLFNAGLENSVEDARYYLEEKYPSLGLRRGNQWSKANADVQEEIERFNQEKDADGTVVEETDSNTEDDDYLSSDFKSRIRKAPPPKWFRQIPPRPYEGSRRGG